MRERIANVITDRLYKSPGLIALVILIIVGLSGWQMSKLTINYNQLELIPQNLPSVLATSGCSSSLEATGTSSSPSGAKTSPVETGRR